MKKNPTEVEDADELEIIKSVAQAWFGHSTCPSPRPLDTFDSHRFICLYKYDTAVYLKIIQALQYNTVTRYGTLTHYLYGTGMKITCAIHIYHLAL